jgi:hypothetical protein
MLRQTNKATGRAVKTQATAGERQRDARRERECRDVQAAINKGYRNQQITDFFKR